MSWSRSMRITALLMAVALVATLVLPTLAFALAAVGGPYSQTISNPDDNGIFVLTPSGGNTKLGASGKFSLSVPAGAVLASKDCSITVWTVTGGKPAKDGGTVSCVADFEPDGLIFEHPNTIYYTYPPGLSNPRAYGYDDDQAMWVGMPDSHVVGNQVVFTTSHFSQYAIGSNPNPTSTPASSTWSLMLAAFAGLAIVAGLAFKDRLSGTKA